MFTKGVCCILFPFETYFVGYIASEFLGFSQGCRDPMRSGMYLTTAYHFFKSIEMCRHRYIDLRSHAKREDLSKKLLGQLPWLLTPT
jgi:hypothetical protein